jgi:SAM-dependent methyltransferase
LLTAGEPPPSSKELASHFAFGRNWKSYAGLIDETRIAQAEQGLVRLLGAGGLAGKSFLDIGCGSGLHVLAAMRLGASRVVAIDLDPIAVETTRTVLQRHGPKVTFEVRLLSVFDLDPHMLGRFDIVYSWGVLHHTGAMHEALERAAQAVAPGGLFVFALYRRTRMCGLWRHEKRWYAAAPPRLQAAARQVYVWLLRLRFLATGSDFRSFVAGYHDQRGMEFMHNVHDWMGGYPYESISSAEVEALMQRLGHEQVRSFTSPPGIGFFGSGCDEYVYRRQDPRSS